MEAGVFLLLLFPLLGIGSTLSFYGDSISFMAPEKEMGGTFKVTFYHRQNGKSNCQDQSSFSCDSGVCTGFNESSVLQTDQDSTGQGRWCQSEGHTTATILTNNASFSLSDSGCCWVSNVEGKTQWTTYAELDLGTRSDTHTVNSCPVTTTVSSLRVPQNCFSRIRILAHDPDGDEVKCRFATSGPRNFTLDETTCTLTSTGDIETGIHVFELMLEDFSTNNITLTYSDGTSVFREASGMNSAPLCKVKLQFSIEVLLPIPNCEAGHVQPIFLYKTPSHGDILHATVGQTFQLYAEAEARHASIHDFQVSGPQNMTKVFKDDVLGKAEVTLSWTPQLSDLYRYVPVCFTAETIDTQSEMRCVVVLVTQASTTQGKATVHCSTNKMTVALDKASMPGIDENFLKLSDPSCSLTSNSTHIMGAMSFSTCGTKIEDKGDYIIFKNDINSFELPTEVITRRKTVKIGFSCQFPKAISISNYYNLHNADYIFTESNFGSFGYTFEIFHNSSFTNRVEASAYPVQVKLLQTIFMGVQARSELPNVMLFVESCKATPDNNPENSLSYYIIRNGCVEDETVTIYPSNQTAFNFGVQAFKFTGNYDQVYITCSVILCEPESPFSRCAQGCLKDPSRRRRRGLSRETGSHYITQGPLQFVGQPFPDTAENSQDVLMERSGTLPEVSPPPASPGTKSSGEGWEMRKIFSSNISTAVFASAFLVSVVLLGIMARYYRKNRRAEDRNVLIASEWEN
ncbi:deleted in malignant brain tumors 1 protein-like [Oreochromis aureus]|uniref:ZP domain-containing protein n=1 Tax=Oreochromis aureus TaxID=47969 RepID=A0AAZ1XAX0_OREAU|nr:deleted in malignant brain tumors 1 protein-like [Oreochromis aureus]